VLNGLGLFLDPIPGLISYFVFQLCSVLVARLEVQPGGRSNFWWGGRLVGPVFALNLPLTVAVLLTVLYFQGWQAAVGWFIVGFIGTNVYAWIAKSSPALGSNLAMKTGLIMMIPFAIAAIIIAASQ
jgi:hypothetical protein